MKKQIAVIKGDGIGPEIVTQAIKVLKAVEEKHDLRFELKEVEMGACAIDSSGEPITNESLAICKESDAVLLGAIGDPRFDNDPTLKVRPEQGLLKLRKELGLYSNVRPTTLYKEIQDFSPLKEERLSGVDLVIYRELIGGIYFGEKKTSEDGLSSSDLCSYSAEQIDRVAHQAFQAAGAREGKLTLVDKANVLETSRLWRKRIAEIANEYPEIKVDYLFVDNAAMQLVQNPGQFDVILTENMFGDILSDLASVLTGSIGMLPSASLGDENALFEPIHGSYPQAKGQDIANPSAMILSVAMMLDHFGLNEQANDIRNAIDWALKQGIGTSDIFGENGVSCSNFGDIIAGYIEEAGELSYKSEVPKEARGIII